MSLSVGTKNSSTRDNWIIEKIKQLPAKVRLLDAGCGEQRFKKYCAHINYVAMDFAEYDGLGDGSGLQTGSFDQSNLDIVADITDIPEPDESFDAIMCIEVIEHVHNPVQAINELTRLLKPGGTMIMTAPFASLTHFAPYHYATGFNRYFYEYHAERLGLHVTEITPNGNFFEFLAQELRRVPYCEQKYSSKVTGKIYQLAFRVILRYLQKLSNHDHGSSEFLNFGWQVVMKKY
jgi:ubiquinone/menaquinone biosynthesis C-methylase UbiE